jgi:hypothetical protein
MGIKAGGVTFTRNESWVSGWRGKQSYCNVLLNGVVVGDDYRTWLGGETLFGPAPWKDCLQWFQNNTPPLPPELCPQ